MTRTRKSVLLTALLVVSAMTAGVSVAEVSNDETTYQTQTDGLTVVPVDSGESFWQGQFLRFTANQTNAGEVWEVRRVENGQLGRLATEGLLDGNGSAVFATNTLDGEYVVVNANDEPVVVEDGVVQSVGGVDAASFEVNTQSLGVSFADAVVRNDDSPAARTDLQVSSNRAGYQLRVFSEQLSPSQLAQVFPSVEVQDGQAVTTRPISNDDVLDANFTNVEAGTYNFTVVSADGSAQDTASVTVMEPVEGSASLESQTVTEERGDVVRFNVTFDGTDRARVQLGSEQVGFVAQFTVVDANGDGRATIAFNTYEAGISPDSQGVSAVGEDEVTDYRLETDPIPGRLDATTYPVVVSVGATRTDIGSILLSQRSTDAIQVWTAPDTANVGSVSQLAEAATQDEEIAYQDWTIVEVQASGLYGYVQNLSDLNDDETGLSMEMIRVGEINIPDRQVSLEQWDLLVDESNNRFFLVVDSNALNRNTTYRANFTVSAENPYVSPENATSLVTNFTVVPRTVSFDQRPVEVQPSSSATISGTSSVAAGTELTVEASNTADAPFLKRQTVTVTEDGTWETTFDFSDVDPGTNFTIDVREARTNATGVVVGEGGAVDPDEAEETTTTETETEETTVVDDAAEETTVADVVEETTVADDAAEETEAADDAAEETEIVDDETTTTTEAALASASVLGSGPVSLLAGLAALVVGGAFAFRRR